MKKILFGTALAIAILLASGVGLSNSKLIGFGTGPGPMSPQVFEVAEFGTGPGPQGIIVLG